MAARFSPTTQATEFTPPVDLVRRNLFSLVSRGELRPQGAVWTLFSPSNPGWCIADLAQVNLLRDADGVERRIALAMPIGDLDYLPAMSLEAVRLLRDVPRSEMRLVVGDSVQLGDAR